jgi:hypothetical protein
MDQAACPGQTSQTSATLKVCAGVLEGRGKPDPAEG